MNEVATNLPASVLDSRRIRIGATARLLPPVVADRGRIRIGATARLLSLG